MKKLLRIIISFSDARTKALASLLTLTGLLGFSQLAMAEDPVYFADSILKAGVESELGISDPTPTDMLFLIFLDQNNSGISDLTGIEYATNLSHLILGNNQIRDISPLSGLTNLATLQLDRNQISNISTLSGLTSLTVLYLDNNQIRDISALSGLTSLSRLWLRQNQISDISALSGLTSLTWLYLDHNQIRDISALSGLTGLSRLWLDANQINDISVLSGLTNLATLLLDRNQISDISALSGLTSLTVLDLRSNLLNIDAYCIYLVLIEDNNSGISLYYDPNPYSDCDEDGTPDACDEDTIDFDGDGVDDGEGEGHGCDNCPNDYNPFQTDCDEDGEGDICDADTIDPDEDGVDVACDNCPNTPNPLQEDQYPPQGNGIGDACDCECDFNCDGNVDATDVTEFLVDFGRNQHNDPCSSQDPCSGDVDCNRAVDANDVIKFVEDLGRNEFNDLCPACITGDWCVYAPRYLIDDIAGDGGKNFPTPQSITLNMGSTTCVDIYLSNVDEPQNAGGAYLDFTGSTADISYVSGGRCMLDSSEGCTGPWTSGLGVFANEPEGPGTVLYVVGNLGGAAPDGDGDLIVGQICLRHDSTNDATINITTIPTFSTWTPIDDEDIIPGSFVIQQ